MSNEPLSVAVVGLGRFGLLTAQALSASQSVRLVGVSDLDAATSARAGRELSVPHYADNRSLLAETRPVAVYAAVPPAAAPELLAVCAERGVHVWKELPLARNLDEGVAFIRRMEKAGLKLAVGTQRRFAATYRHASELRTHVQPVFLARSHYLFNWGPQLGWRGDRVSAGGGALLELGYHFIDLLIWMLGLPEEVYGLCASGSRSGASPGEGEAIAVYDTDDTAAALLRYGDGSMATVVTTRSSGPVSEELCLHGRGGSLLAGSGHCTLRDPDGNVLDHLDDEDPPQAVFRRQAESFAHAVTTGAARYECSGMENLLNLATIEAIYLAGRTGQPERPAALLETHGLSEDDCLRLRPPAYE